MRLLIFLSIFFLVSCVSKPADKTYSVKQLCPAFEEPAWRSVSSPKGEPSKLINKQKFAVSPSHKTYWFEARDDYIGLCILPAKSDLPGCATAYATYRWEKEDWILQEQKVTICPS